MEDKRVEDVLKRIISKAWEDANFRKELISDPINTIENYTGAKVVLPEGKELIVLDQTDKNKVFVNIPSEPDFEDVELSENQLETIAGGGQVLWNNLLDSLFPTLKTYMKF
jgi:hypothetical protein